MRVMCGDQSPLNGGLLRAALLAQADPSLDIIYCFHDTDAPWLQTGGSPRIVQGGWPDYWALAARIPYSPDIPGLVGGDAWQRLRDSLNIPSGIVYLAGPQTNETIASMDACPVTGELMRRVHGIEAEWAYALNNMLGRSPGMLGPLPARLSEVPGAIRNRFARDYARIEITRSTEFWREHPVRFHETVPPKYYWRLDERNCRYAWDGRNLSRGHYLVPRAHIRSLEEAAHGIADCFTAIPYLNEVVKLRNLYVPGLSLPHIQMTITCSLPLDPLEAMKDVFKAKKRDRIERKRRGGRPDYDELIPELPGEEAAAIWTYWRGRPTSISHEILGGTLTATLAHRTL